MFDTRDFRNARYQGQTKNNQPNGIGIVIDYNYLFCLAQWKQGKIDGAAFVVFPDSRIFCGRIHNNQLQGLCSFYLQDRIQIYANYSQKQTERNNFIAILPFCKVILQIDRNSTVAKVSRHETYSLDDNSLINKLDKIFGKRFDLSEFQGWKNFLYFNFAKPYSRKLYWKEINDLKRQEIFIGLKYDGLGVKIINLLDQKEITGTDGDCFIITGMGSFTNQQQLRGLGKQLVQYSKFKMQEEGIYGQRNNQIFQYPRKERPQRGEKIFVRQLKTSFNFNNAFFDLKICYELLNKYEKINVELMQQNRKIAQIIIEKKDDSVVLAQIQNKKQRKLTPQRSERQIQSEYQRVKQVKRRPQNTKHEFQPSDYSIYKSPSQISVNPQAKKSIYSSAEKIKKNKNSPRKASEAIAQRTNISTKYQYKQSPSFKKCSPQRSKTQLYQYPNNSIEKQPRTLSKNRENKKYLYQTILDNPNSLNPSSSYLQSKVQKRPAYIEKSTYNISSNYDSRQKYPCNEYSRYTPTIKKVNREQPSFDSRKQSSKYTYPNQSRQRLQSPPLLKRHHNSRESEQSKNSDLINFFNRKITEEYPSYSDLNKGFIQTTPKSNVNWTLGNTPKRQKTPGKIITFKKKHDPNTIYQ